MSANKKRRKKKKKNGLFSAFVRAVILLLVLAFLGALAWQLRGYMSDNATTAIARGDRLGNNYHGTLVVARDESVYETENMTRIDFIAEEGSRVSRSNVICKVYSSGYNQTEINKLNTARSEIQEYHINQVLNTYVDAALDSENEEIDSLARQVRTLVQGRGVGSLTNLEKQLESSLNVRKNYLRQKYPDDQTLSELYKVENDQLKKIESWTTTHTASEDCIVSFYTDGYERIINGETYANLSPQQVRAVARGVAPEQVANMGIDDPKKKESLSRGMNAIFRTISEDEWFALFLCTDKDWNPVVGEVYRMSLTGFDDSDVNARVESFSRIGNDLLLRMRINTNVDQILNIRTCGATVGDFISGVHVPINALYTYDNMIGVVVLEAGIQTFVPVTVITYPDENTAFVRPTLAGSPLDAGKTVMLF